LIVNQARVLDYFAEAARNAPGRIRPDYGYEFVGLAYGGGDYPVEVTIRDAEGAFDAEEGTFIDLSPASDVDPGRGGGQRVIQAKYVVGCDGARSAVRSSIGRVMAGDQAMHAWAVMDVVVVTDFPDIRTKCAINSEAGSILHIPREGGHLFRMYVDLGELTEGTERTIRETTVEEAIAQANRILHPYTLNVRHVAWYSVYEVAHRLTDKFDDADDSGAWDAAAPRVFITGDACHTHSAKAGQGMNVSMQDGFNIGWKLGAVLQGLSPASLLTTYDGERRQIAADLIAFDREWSAMMAKKPEEFEDPHELDEFYLRTFEFPTGFMTQYRPSMITGADTHQGLATGFPIGKRFRSEVTTRVADANVIHLGHHATADGRWRIYAFADSDGWSLKAWAAWMADSADSPVRRFTPAGGERDSVFDVKVVYQQQYTEVDLAAVPEFFFPRVGPWQLRDYEKVYATNRDTDVFATRGIDRDGAVVVVRPDQYVAHVLPLAATGELAGFFAQHMLRQ
jgi:phenol 2-monooxygenase